ncbi:MAG: c-type cytochrome [Proteobacteria bacterium]|nr:c-type cytochrome [Pseudomonadota bacterium]
MKKIIASVTTVALLTVGASMAVASGDGEAVFKKKCKACHTITEKKKMGPGLKGVFGRESDKAGKLDEAGLTTWLKNPKAVNAKAKMPNLKLKDDQIAAVIGYLKTL